MFPLSFLSWTWCVFGSAVGYTLTFVTAWYSRHYTGWTAFGVTVPGGIGWLLMETVSVACLHLTFFLSGGKYEASVQALLLALWSIHYFYRCFIYPFTRFVKPLPLEVVLAAAFFNLCNGSLNGASLATECKPRSPVGICGGIAIWAIGFALNVHSDDVVRRLRRSPADRDVYKIPPPYGLHRWLASPNYSAEAFEWLGFAIASGMCPAAVSFFVWTVCNLAPRAIGNRKWYVKKFGDAFPAERKIFIPFVW